MSRALSFGPFVFDTEALAVARDGEDVALPPRAAQVLECLVAHPGEIVLKDDLLAAAWPDSFVSEDSLTHAISLIRQCLGDDARKPVYVQTVPKRGYRFVAEVRPAGMPESARGSESAAAAPVPPPVPTLALAAGAVVVLLVVLAISPWLASSPGVPAEVDPGPVPALEIRRLTVDRFATDDEQLQPLAERTRDAIVDALERHTEFSVSSIDLSESADADAQLSGRIEARDGRLLLGVRIHATANGEDWWVHEWDLPAAQFTPDAFAASLVSRAKFLFDLTGAYSTLRRSTNPDAVRLVVQASELLLGPAMLDLRVAAEAADVLRRATELDPHFARARAGRIATLAESVYWAPWSEQEHADAANELARAEEDDPRDPLVFVGRALLALVNEQPEQMREAIDRAAQLDPRLFWVYMIRADLERRAGLHAAALATVRRGLALDPYFPALHDRLIEVHLDAGDLEAAAGAAATLAELTPDSYYSERAQARVMWAAGDVDGAQARLASLRDRYGDSPWVYRLLHDVYLETGKVELADRMAETYRALQR